MELKPKSEGGKVIDARERFARRSAVLPPRISSPFKAEKVEDWELTRICSEAAVYREPLRNKCHHLHEAGEEMCLEFPLLERAGFFWEILSYMANAPDEYFSDYRQKARYRCNNPKQHLAAQMHFFNQDSCGYKALVLHGYWLSLEESLKNATDAKREGKKDADGQVIMILQVRALFIDMLSYAHIKYLRDVRRGQQHFPDAG